jgi:DNA-binding LytR/AlgR family response regulator
MTRQYFFIKNNGRYERVNLSDILYIESNGNYLKIVTVEKTSLIHMGIQKMQDALPMNQFCRIHRSYIVALDRIQSFDQYMVYLPGHIIIPVGKEYKAAMGQQLWLIQKEQQEEEKSIKKMLSI